MESIQVRSRSRNQFVDITAAVRAAIKNTGIQEGLAVVYVTHTTAGITINEAADPSVVEDIMKKLSDLVPRSEGYRHMEGNSDAHIKASLMGSSVTLIVSGGAPILGTWQGVFFCEFDGPRTRTVRVMVVPAG